MKFQDDISMPNTYTHTHTRTSRNQYVPHFFKVGRIKRSTYWMSRGHASCFIVLYKENLAIVLVLLLCNNKQYGVKFSEYL